MNVHQEINSLQARNAGLCYVYDADPGIGRLRWGRGFIYLDPHEKRVTDEKTLNRIKTLAVPPAWDRVWICPKDNGHLQATGFDVKKRKQYRYHEKWRLARDMNKFESMIKFGHTLPSIRRRVAQHLKEEELSREKVIAAVIRLLDKSGLRIGNAEYEAVNKSYGLTTLHKKHVEADKDTIALDFVGKGQKRWNGEIHDPMVASVIHQCEDLPGYRLFKYLDEDGHTHTIESSDVNNLLREWTQEDITAKDFRTWHACMRFMEEALKAHQGEGAKLTQLLSIVANELGNTPTMIKKSYVHPLLITLHKEKRFGAPEWSRWQKKKPPAGLHKSESVLLHWLERTGAV